MVWVLLVEVTTTPLVVQDELINQRHLMHLLNYLMAAD